MHRTLAFNVPVMSYGKSADEIINFYREVMRRIEELPGVDHVSLGTSTPWRDAGSFGAGFSFTGEGHVKGTKEEDPRANFRVVSPGYFASLGVPILAGRDFNTEDKRGGEPVIIIPARAWRSGMFPGEDPVNRHLMYTDPVMEIRLHQHGSAPHHRRCQRCGRRARRARPISNDLSPVRSDSRRQS